MKKYKIQRQLIGGTWEDSCFDEITDANGYGKQVVTLFDSKEDAEKEITEYLKEINFSIKNGLMDKEGKETRDDLRIVKVTNK